MDRARYAATFSDPPARLRPLMLFSWTGSAEPARITAMLEQYKARGIGGVFVIPRKGYSGGYLEPEWFRIWEHALRECGRLGMECDIYDEFFCPSGYAGGQVAASRPSVAREELVAVDVVSLDRGELGRAVSFHAVDPTTGVARKVEKEQALAWAAAPHADPHVAPLAEPDERLLALLVRPSPPSPGQGGFPYVDLCNPETTREFLRTTYEPYARHFGADFGKTIRFAFTDEPQLTHPRSGLHVSSYILREFFHEHGYELLPLAGELVYGGADAGRVRFDYFRTLDRLFNRNYVHSLDRWCDEHGLILTGHFMEHEWPSPICQPDAMSSLRWMRAPGNDLLGFQFTASDPGRNGIYFLNLKELASVANQLGRDAVVVESCGGGGYEAAFELYKPLEDWLVCNGVNVINPHLSHETLCGAAKYDWAQTMSDHASWWEHYRHHADHVARLIAAIGAGTERNRVLVLHPTTTGWLRWEPSGLIPGFPRREEPLERLRDAQVSLLLGLYGAQVDFDLGDELIMEELGSVRGRALVVGDRSYDAVVVPPATENLTQSTVRLLEAFLDSGGLVFAGAAAPAFVDGVASDAPAGLRSRGGKRWRVAESLEALVAGVREAIPPRLADPSGRALPPELCWRRVELDDQTTGWMFCNPWSATLRATVVLPRGRLFRLDTASGTITPASGPLVPLDLAPRGHELYVQTADEAPSWGAAQPPRPAARAVPVMLGTPAIERDEANVLVLDYCDIRVGRRVQHAIPTPAADTLAWQWNGWPHNPWRAGVQYRREIMDSRFGEETECEVTYRFLVDAGGAPPAGLALALERPWLYQASLNGEEVSFVDAPAWFDVDMRLADLRGLARVGENTVRLCAKPFHPLCQVMPVYVVGGFGLRRADRGFAILPETPIVLGDLRAQGMPFYCGKVSYRFPFAAPEDASGLRVTADAWEGAVVDVGLDGRRLGLLVHPPYRLSVACPVPRGEHSVCLTVHGTPRSMMGPFHSDGLPIGSSWVDSPSSQPPGAAYRGRALGLTEPPKVELLA